MRKVRLWLRKLCIMWNSTSAVEQEIDLMRIHLKHNKYTFAIVGALALTLAAFAPIAVGQAPPPPPSYPPSELDRLVSRVALYPDPLLSQILAAATFSYQI